MAEAPLMQAMVAVLDGHATEDDRGHRIVAHRGGAALGPENTLPAFQASAQLGIVEVETDVRLSRDGFAVLFHHARLDRTTNGRGPVADHYLSELKALDAGSWWQPAEGSDIAADHVADIRPLSLKELFGTFGESFVYHLDLKAKGYDVAETAMEEVLRAGLAKRTFVTGYHLGQLLSARALAPGVRVGWTISEGAGTANPEHLVAAAGKGIDEVAVRWYEMTPSLAQAAAENGVAIRAFGFVKPDDTRRALELGATALTLDDPRPEWLSSASN